MTTEHSSDVSCVLVNFGEFIQCEISFRSLLNIEIELLLYLNRFYYILQFNLQFCLLSLEINSNEASRKILYIFKTLFLSRSILTYRVRVALYMLSVLFIIHGGLVPAAQLFERVQVKFQQIFRLVKGLLTYFLGCVAKDVMVK